MKLPIKDIKSNPNNPRLIKDDKFKKLVQSLKDFPIMAKKLRRVVIDENNVILGGNMRYKAIVEAGLKEVYVDQFTREDAEENNRLAKEINPAYIDKTYEEQCKEFIIKDNVSGGEWDWDILANNWNNDFLELCGLETPTSWDNEDNVMDSKDVPEEKLMAVVVVAYDDINDLDKLTGLYALDSIDITEDIKNQISSQRKAYVFRK